MRNSIRLILILGFIVLLAGFAYAYDVEVHIASGSTTDGDLANETISGVENSEGSAAPYQFYEQNYYAYSSFGRGFWGYGWVDGIDFSWITLNNPTTLNLGDDDVSSAIDLGFTASFYGEDYNQIRVSSNGFIVFPYFGETIDSGCCAGQNLPNPNTPNNLVVGWWEDLQPASGGGTGTIKYKKLGYGASEYMVVEFNNVGHYNALDKTVSFQIVIREKP